MGLGGGGITLTLFGGHLVSGKNGGGGYQEGGGGEKRESIERGKARAYGREMQKTVI